MDETITRVPAMLDALYARLRAAMTGWQVYDGPPAGSTIPPDVLVVGFADHDGQAVTNSLSRQDGLGGPRYVETFQVACLLATTGGDTTIKNRRDRLLAGLGLIDAALKEDRGLGGVVDATGLGPDMDWAQGQTADGSAAEVLFSIVGRALL